MKAKTLIYRTLVFSYFPEKLAADCFLPAAGHRRILKTGNLAKRFRISVGRMKEQLEDLEKLGFITDLTIDRYVATYTVSMPG